MLRASAVLLLLLFAGHALCDFPLQGDFLARGKNHKAPLPGVPWQYCLFAHALIHAGAVFLLTRSLILGLAELVFHAATDYAKCDGRFTPAFPGVMLNWRRPFEPAFIARTADQCNAIAFDRDQAIHYGCKVVWCALAIWWSPWHK